MDAGVVAEISREAVYVLIAVSAPVLILALVIGLIISLLQALTQIQEQTLTFVPKIISVYFGMIFILPYMFSKLKVFVDHIIQHIVQ
ncbi:Flagellar biosynthetic protein FliQ [Candidatus Megaera venefica]|jgi:flagellar biosynthetic protein FliQ|uniref:Flagellar biosynthetic protein FliQ n=1 Tax=Candidatus Megaera venefica TaxID=2055910 RepID=A0ABU5NAZ2_9RICK|nr:flagellar biosynthesis protein FliQ [Candidatus Megaera venefica]MEA0970338.1 Flagellar biosynthetic protein FliQ [Candidatus Megaera venefica]